MFNKKRIILPFIFLIFSIFITPSFSSEIEDDYIDIAANYCIVGDYNSAMQYLDKVLTINSSNTRAQNLKKGLYHIISKDKKTFIENVNPTVKQAMEYKRVGNEQSELETLLKAAQQPNSYIAYYFLGNFYRSKNQYQKALDAYNSSTSARSDFAPAYLSTAITLYDMGNYKSVINPIDKYISLNPNDDLAYALKSRAEFALGNIAKAEIYNYQALSMNKSTEYEFDKAKILYMQGNYKDSKALFTKLLKNIQTSKIYEYIGLCDYAMQDYNSALLNFDKAILLSNDDEYLKSKYNEIKQILENK